MHLAFMHVLYIGIVGTETSCICALYTNLEQNMMLMVCRKGQCGVM